MTSSFVTIFKESSSFLLVQLFTSHFCAVYVFLLVQVGYCRRGLLYMPPSVPKKFHQLSNESYAPAG